MGRAQGGPGANTSRPALRRRSDAFATLFGAARGLTAAQSSERERPSERDRLWMREFADYGIAFDPGEPWSEAWRDSTLDSERAGAWAAAYLERRGRERCERNLALYVAEAEAAEALGLVDEEAFAWHDEDFWFTAEQSPAGEWLQAGFSAEDAAYKRDAAGG